MVAGCSEGIHWLAACFLGRRAVRAARHTGVSGVLPLASTRGAAAGAVACVRRAAIGRFVDSVMAAWLRARDETKLGIEKIAGPSACNTLAISRPGRSRTPPCVTARPPRPRPSYAVAPSVSSEATTARGPSYGALLAMASNASRRREKEEHKDHLHTARNYSVM